LPLNEIYQNLLTHFGPQNWWPGDSPFEVCVGAILTQNTNWSNVEKAIVNLKDRGLLDFKSLYLARDETIAELIRPAGYFNVKTKRLRSFLNFIQEKYGEFDALNDLTDTKLREELLSVKGVGAETADSMVLYAFNRPKFVIDTYTHRILSRHSLIPEDADYYQMQELFENNLETDEELFNEYHALIVMVAKNFCKKSKPSCEECPLKDVNGGAVLPSH
jgi:endonuclease III related protein